MIQTKKINKNGLITVKRLYLVGNLIGLFGQNGFRDLGLFIYYFNKFNKTCFGCIRETSP